MKDNKVVVLLNDPSSGLWPSSPSRSEGNGVRGFTLIELLVVVLIIGILAAVVVPQYQKAVWKSRMTHLISLQKSIALAQKAYYLAHGTYPTQFSQLDISADNLTAANESTLNAQGLISDTDIVRYNDLFEILLYDTGNATWIRNGKYKGCGFAVNFQTDEWTCKEWEQYYTEKEGTFCQKIMGTGEKTGYVSSVRRFSM